MIEDHVDKFGERYWEELGLALQNVKLEICSDRDIFVFRALQLAEQAAKGEPISEVDRKGYYSQMLNDLVEALDTWHVG